MKKTITIAATLFSISLFSGFASADSFGQRVEGDMLYGNGAVAANRSDNRCDSVSTHSCLYPIGFRG